VGILLLVLGIVLIIVGVVASRSLADNLSTVFRGRLTQGTLWYIIGGIASAGIGLLLTLGVIGRTKT
jgi:H+/Cl- antiporter ClcA